MSDTLEKLEHILDRLAVRMYDEGQLDKPSLLGRQVAVVNIRETQEAISDLIESAKREGARQELEYMMTGKKTVTQYADSSFDDLVTYVFAASEIQDRLAQLKLSEESE